MITIEIRGEKEVIDALRDYQVKSDVALKRALIKTGLLIQSAAKLRLQEMKHYVTGRLASSIHTEVQEGWVKSINKLGGTTYDYKATVSKEVFDGSLKEIIGPLEVIVGTNVVYAEFIETMKDPYLRFAAEQGDAELPKYVEEQIDRLTVVAMAKRQTTMARKWAKKGVTDWENYYE